MDHLRIQCMHATFANVFPAELRNILAGYASYSEREKLLRVFFVTNTRVYESFFFAGRTKSCNEWMGICLPALADNRPWQKTRWIPDVIDVFHVNFGNFCDIRYINPARVTLEELLPSRGLAIRVNDIYVDILDECREQYLERARSMMDEI